MREPNVKAINPRPGACVCVARWNGDIVYDNPRAYNPITQGDSEKWIQLKEAKERMEGGETKWQSSETSC